MVWERGKSSRSYGFVPMQWVPQLKDIRISLSELQGRSPTLIWMLYVQWTVSLFCTHQSSDQDLNAGIMQLYPKKSQRARLGYLCRPSPCDKIILSLPSFCIRRSVGRLPKMIWEISHPPTLKALFFSFSLFHLQVWHASVRVHETPYLICGLGKLASFLGHMVLCQWSGFHN